MSGAGPGGSGAVPRILHLHATFDAGAKEQRTVRLINAIGKSSRNAIVSGDPARRGAAAGLTRGVHVTWPVFPPMRGAPWPGKLKALAAAMAGYDLICTYNWGAINAAFAHTLFADVFRLPPLVHHEDGSGEDEAGGLTLRRNYFRRIALGRTAALVVPSRALERIALGAWAQPRARVRLIPDGIQTAAFARKPRPDALVGLIKHRGELWVGTLAPLRAEEGLPALVRACRNLPEAWQLVIAGEGPERAAIVAEAEACGIEDRVHLPGAVADPAKAAGLFDLFALSSHAEQDPRAVVEAMAAGLAVVAPRVGEIGALVASENGPYLAAPGDEAALSAALAALAADPEARHRIGEANRARARSEFDESRMIERYRALYWGLLGRR
ncbi:MAG: glycosyl transferase family 1 [Sphingomonadales bacterium 32-68-7]|nr:MAG: glycosyl transferase family 1 [Sphingomonadales bacterium 12-68-11]OYX07700.1 MAG: glycosyl transferase family 1 [Sphingomonadales bacterium 32-68-7]